MKSESVFIALLLIIIVLLYYCPIIGYFMVTGVAALMLCNCNHHISGGKDIPTENIVIVNNIIRDLLAIVDDSHMRLINSLSSQSAQEIKHNVKTILATIDDCSNICKTKMGRIKSNLNKLV